MPIALSGSVLLVTGGVRAVGPWRHYHLPRYSAPL